MTVTSPDAAPRSAIPHFECTLVASGWQKVRASDFPNVRTTVATAFAGTLGGGVLKQADEQSVLALLAMHEALKQARLSADEIEDWGLVAAPRSPGRRRIAESLAKFREQGAWSTSPHVIPHCSLHSLPGLISQGFRLHGPNIGAGGLPGAEQEAFWLAQALVHGERVPGVWIVLTGWDRETLEPTEQSCQAAVLGLSRQAAAHAARLRFVPGDEDGQPRVSLEALGEVIAARSAGAFNAAGATLELTYTGARLEAAA